MRCAASLLESPEPWVSITAFSIHPTTRRSAATPIQQVVWWGKPAVSRSGETRGMGTLPCRRGRRRPEGGWVPPRRGSTQAPRRWFGPSRPRRDAAGVCHPRARCHDAAPPTALRTTLKVSTPSSTWPALRPQVRAWALAASPQAYRAPAPPRQHCHDPRPRRSPTSTSHWRTARGRRCGGRGKWRLLRAWSAARRGAAAG
mmetsp:Transcript_6521/g.16646  ORF Transcript_6521/g.16646 Transcript_6521/m.16646 type:complete len:201 (+) Transcript_6521:126-728(+)